MLLVARIDSKYMRINRLLIWLLAILFPVPALSSQYSFYPYTSKLADQTIKLLEQSTATKWKILENTPYCKKNREVFGYVPFSDFTYGMQNIVGICTFRIISEDSKDGIDRVIFHEAVHASQFCHPSDWVLGIPASHIPDSIKSWVQNGSLYSNNTEESNQSEYEAYYLEDYPEEVNSYLVQNCHR